MMDNFNTVSDPYLRFTKDMTRPRRGLSLIDELRMNPFKNVVRTHEMGVREAYQTYKRRETEILCRGCAAGLVSGEDVVTHVHVSKMKNQKFVGFVYSNLENNLVHVWTRGSTILKIPNGVLGSRVYSTGPNEFNVSGDGLLVGVIRFVQEDCCAVSFKCYADIEPYELMSKSSMRSRGSI